MGKEGTIFIVLGVILLIVGVIFLVMFAVGTANSKLEEDATVATSWSIGGKSASKITGEFTSTQPLNVYVSTGLSLSDADTIAQDSTGGKIDYETPDSGKDYYVHFVNQGSSSADVHVSIEFYSPIGLICLIPGIIMLALSIVFLFLGFKARKQPDTAPSPYPQQPVYQPQQQYPPQQYPQQQYQPPPQYPQQQPAPSPPPSPPPSQPPPTKAVTYNCPHCGKPFTVQSTGQPQVVSCPSCGGQTTVT